MNVSVLTPTLSFKSLWKTRVTDG